MTSEELETGSTMDAGSEAVADVQEQAKLESAKTEPAAEQPKEQSLRESLAQGLKEARDNAAKADKPQAPKAPETKTAEAGKPTATTAVDKNLQQPKATIAAPPSWSAPAKAKFSTLDPVLQNEILKREKEVHQKFTAMDEERGLGKSIKEASAPYEAIIRAEGGDAVKAFKDFLNHAYLLRTASPQQKGQMLLQIAQRYGADLRVNPNQQVNPEVQQLQKTVQQLQWEREQERLNQQQQTQATIQAQIEAFSAKPENVHFETVKADMAALLSGGRAKDLQEAYDMAVWARPDIRSTLLQAQVAEAEAKKRQEAQAKVAAARKAGSSVVGSPGVTPSALPADRSLRDELRANLAAARA